MSSSTGDTGSSWSVGVAAEAKKAGSASLDTLLTPIPPNLMERLAWRYCEWDKVLLVKFDSADLNRSSNFWSLRSFTDGEQRCSRRWTLEEPNNSRIIIIIIIITIIITIIIITVRFLCQATSDIHLYQKL